MSLPDHKSDSCAAGFLRKGVDRVVTYEKVSATLGEDHPVEGRALGCKCWLLFIDAGHASDRLHVVHVANSSAHAGCDGKGQLVVVCREFGPSDSKAGIVPGLGVNREVD